MPGTPPKSHSGVATNCCTNAHVSRSQSSTNRSERTPATALGGPLKAPLGWVLILFYFFIYLVTEKLEKGESLQSLDNRRSEQWAFTTQTALFDYVTLSTAPALPRDPGARPPSRGCGFLPLGSLPGTACRRQGQRNTLKRGGVMPL